MIQQIAGHNQIFCGKRYLMASTREAAVIYAMRAGKRRQDTDTRLMPPAKYSSMLAGS